MYIFLTQSQIIYDLCIFMPIFDYVSRKSVLNIHMLAQKTPTAIQKPRPSIPTLLNP